MVGTVLVSSKRNKAEPKYKDLRRERRDVQDRRGVRGEVKGFVNEGASKKSGREVVGSKDHPCVWRDGSDW